MVHTGIYATSGETLFYAGSGHANIDETQMNSIHKIAEGKIHAKARKDFSGAFGSMSVSKRAFLTGISARLTAIDVLEYGMATTNVRSEDESRINILSSLVTTDLN